MGLSDAENLGMVHDVRDAEHCERREIDQHDGAEHRADLRRPSRLDEEQADRMLTAIGITSGSSQCLATVRPSTAESTEIAGVIIASL